MSGDFATSNVSSIDYGHLLDDFNLDFVEDKFYLRVGNPKCDQGWILHITVVPVQMEDLCRQVIPVLNKYEFPFKIIRNRDLHKDLNGGDFGQFKVGKAITVFLDQNEGIFSCVSELILLTKPFGGPRAVTDLPISNIISTRYGSFINRTEIDTLGNRVRVISDQNGNIVLDKYYIPPMQPEWVFNPFVPFVETVTKPPKTILIGNRVMPFRLLKNDVKGNVWKGLYIDRFFLFKWCVVKQGKRGIFPDEFGRDARDRLAWQFLFNKRLRSSLKTPIIWEHLSVNEDSFVVMKYVPGSKVFLALIRQKLNCKVWKDQSIIIRRELLGYLLQVASAIHTLHKKGYVHRDITGSNFLIGRGGDVHLIDLELMYSVEDGQPSPPFGVGTEGYMSPEQKLRLLPSFADDSYSLGALIGAVVLGEFEPAQFIDMDNEVMNERLLFFCGDKSLTELILQCISVTPSERPNASEIYDRLETNRRGLVTLNDESRAPWHRDLPFLVRQAVVNGIRSLSGDLFTSNGLWFSKINNEYDMEVYPLQVAHVFGGLHRGLGGVIWILAELAEVGFDVQPAEGNIKNSLNYLECSVFSRVDYWDKSLHYGNAGFALALARSIDVGFSIDNIENRSLIISCFEKNAVDLSLISGIAGQGLAVIQCEEFIGKEAAEKLLVQYSKIILDKQESDGSWKFFSIETLDEEKNSTFGYGAAGVIYFLLEFGHRTGDKISLSAAYRGLDYLAGILIKGRDFVAWPRSDKNKTIGQWWCNGGPGMALSFLKAYEIGGNARYLDIAEKAMNIHSDRFVTSNLSQCHGLTGLGEIYLEAFRITKDRKWWDRASWIVDVLLALCRRHSSGGVYWWVDDIHLVTADLMVGNSGIIHFLIRYLFPDRIGFPLLPKPI